MGDREDMGAGLLSPETRKRERRGERRVLGKLGACKAGREGGEWWTEEAEIGID